MARPRLVTVTRSAPVRFTVDMDRYQVIDVEVDSTEVSPLGEAHMTSPDPVDLAELRLAMDLVDRPDHAWPDWRVA
jgi:hypothetical protein